MVAVVSNSGLGLFGSSLSALGGSGAAGQGAVGRGTDRVFVNTATGNLVVQSQDEILRALGLDLALVRTYNSQGLLDDDNGDNWRLGVHQRVFGLTGTLNSAGSTITKVFGDGREVLYRYDSAQARYVSTDGDGAHDTLSYSSEQWTWTEGSSRQSETYNSTGQLIASRDADGNTIAYAYTGALLTQITDASGQTTYLDYSGNNLSQIRVVSNGQTQTLTRYTYDGSNRLSQVRVDLSPQDNSITDNQVYTTTYGYDGTSRRIASITQSDGSSVAFTYQLIDAEYRVRTYTDGEGRVTTLTYTQAATGAGSSVSAPANGAVLSTTDTQGYSLNSGALSAWRAAALLETTSLAAANPQVAFDAQGNGFAVWTQGSDVWMRRYTAASGSWAAAVALDSGGTAAYAPALAVDAGGNAVVAWVQSDGTANSLYARHFSAASGSWSAVGVLESASEAVETSLHSLAVAVRGETAAVAWIQPEGAQNNLYASIWDVGEWWGSGVIDSGSGAVSRPSIAIDEALNATVLWQQSDGAAESIYASRYSTATWTWSAAQLLESAAVPAGEAKLAVDANGDGIALWTQGNDLVTRRYVRSTDSWSAAGALDSGATAVYAPSLSVDELTGNALAAWVQSDGVAHSVYASRYDAASGAWGAAELVESAAPAVANGAGSVVTARRGGYAAVAWLQSEGSVNSVYASHWTGSAWSAARLLESSAAAAAQPAVALDAQGNASVVWQQSDGSASSIYSARYAGSSGVLYYTVPSGASWQSVANTLYGVNSAQAGAALQAALGNPALTAGVDLSGFPAQLSVTASVPAYYTVQSGNSWSSITQTIYGTSDVNAVAALQAALGSPVLSAGVRLTVPLTLNYGGTTLYLQTDVQDTLGQVTTYVKDSAGRLTNVLSPAVNGVRLEMRYSYDAAGNVTTIAEDPSGLNRISSFEYDASGNLLLSRDTLGNTVSRTYTSNNQLLTEMQYRVPDPDGAGSAQPAVPLTTRYAYDSEQHLRFAISAQGHVTEHRYSTAGERITSFKYTGALYTAANFAESDLIAWAAVQDLTRLERSEYAYDFRGNLSSLTTYAYTDAGGVGILASRAATYFVYDQRGLLLQTIDPRGASTTADPNDYRRTFTYDGLGRVLVATEWVSGAVSRSTSTAYDDVGNRTVTTFANGLVTISQYDDAGQLVSVADSGPDSTALGTTSYTYDGNGRLRMVSDPAGQRLHHLYDAAGRKIAEIDADGTLTEFVYGRTSQIVKTIRYAVRLDPATLIDAGGNPLTPSLQSLRSLAGINPAADRIERSVYDAAGRLVHSVAADGALTQKFYDGASQLVATVRYATRVTIARTLDELAVADITVPAASPEDRRSRVFYDSDGRVLATLDGEGGLIEHEYDAGGRLVRTIAYAGDTPLAQRQSGTLQQLRPTGSNDDIHTRFFYDGQGRRVGTLDGEGHLTQVRYDVAGNVVEEVRYDAEVIYVSGATLDDLIPASAPTRSTRYAYDGLDRLVEQTDPQGTVTRSAYDAAGRLVSETRAADTSEARTTQARYDALGRVTQELTAQGSAAITASMTNEQLNAVWAQYSVRHEYDVAGRRIATTDQNGNRTLFYYDADGRVRYAVNALGEVRESRYDAFGDLTDRISYFNAIATIGLTGGLVAANLVSRIVADARDAHDTFTYRVTGQVATAATAEGGLVSRSYNAFGEEASRSERIDAGRSLAHSYSYDRRGLLTQTVWDADGVGQLASWDYDAFGRVERTTDRQGLQRETRYDRLGRTVEVRDPVRNLGLSSTSYDAFGRVLTSTDALNNVTRYAYDDTARSVVVTTPENISVTTVYNRHGQTATVTDPRGRIVRYEYDADGRLRRTSDAQGTLSESSYDRAGLLVESRDANGVLTSLAYDAANRILTRTVDPAGLRLVTAYVYDNGGRTVTVTDPRGMATRTEYDRDGRTATVTVDPAGLNLRTVYAYDARGKVLRVTEGTLPASQRVTEYAYDELGRRTRETVDPGAGRLNLTTQYFYDARDNLVTKTDAGNNVTRYAYDSENRLRYTVDALGDVTENVYDTANRLTSTRRYANPVSLAGAGQSLTVAQVNALLVANPLADRVRQSVYDRDGRESFVIDSLNGVTRKDYDGNGNVVRTTAYAAALPAGVYGTVQEVEAALLASPNDRVIDAIYDARNLARYTVDALGGIIRNSYDAAGNLIAQTAFAVPRTGSGPLDAAALDAWVQANANPAADRTRRSWYDAAGREVFALDAEGFLTETRHADSARRRTEIRYAVNQAIAAGASLEQVKAAAAALAANADNQSTRTDYDAAGRAIRTTDALGAFETYGYDELGNRTSFTNKKNDTWTYRYDANRRLTDELTPLESIASVVDAAGALQFSTEVVQIRTHIEYDALGNVKRRTEAVGRPEERTTSYEYDALGRQIRTIFPKVDVYSAPAGDESRAGAAVVRAETEATPGMQVTYDALGNALVNRDVAGSYSYKVYDRLGRLRYEIDAKSYLTEHRYDVFGNETQLIRYAAPVNTAARVPGAIWTEADVLASRTVNDAADRTLVTDYDRLNRATRITQPVVFNFEPNQSVAGGAGFSAAPATRNEYDSFGQLIRQSKLLDPAADRWSVVTYYYDRRGYKTAEVSPHGYLTTYTHDETGDLKRQVEYARALSAGSWSPSGYAAPIVTTRATAPDSPTGYDRETVFAYDRLNRKTGEIRVNVEYSEVGGQTVTARLGDRTTSFGYDALGNQTQRTEANGATTYTYYDKLGRVIAIAEPTRDAYVSDSATVSLTPLVELSRNAHGNIVRERRAAGGATSANAQSYTAAAPVAADRITHIRVDRQGHALQTVDPTGANRYASYTVRGEVAKEWQPVTNADGALDMLVTIREYDSLGRESRVIEPQTLGAATLIVQRTVEYNAFGEIIFKGGQGGQQEYFEYDQAGRLWRTNSGDGVGKVYLYNLKGEATAEIRSKTLDLKTFAGAQQAHNQTDVLRTETRYDLEGHVVERRLPVFTTSGATERIVTPLTISQIAGPERPVYPGVVYYARVPDYGQPPGPEPIGYRYVVSPTTPRSQDGGYYRPAAGGDYVQDPNFNVVQAVRIAWDAPTTAGDPSIVVKFEYRPLGSTAAMSSLPVDVLSASRIGVNVHSLAGQSYEYRLTYQRRADLNPFAEASGAFNVDGSSTSTITVNPAPAEASGEVATLAATHSNGFVNWAAPADASVNAVLKVRNVNSSVWIDIAATRSGADFRVDVRAALSLAGTYEYEIHYTRGSELIARKVGQLTSGGYREYQTVTGTRTELPVIVTVATVGTVTGTAGVSVSAAIVSDGRLEARFAGGVPGPDNEEYRWMGTNSVSMGWGNLGSGRVRVVLDYITESESAMQGISPAQAAQREQIFASGATGAVFQWGEDGVWRPDVRAGSIGQVTRVRVYTESSPGAANWAIRYDQSNPAVELGHSLSWAAPSDANVVPSFEIAPRNSGAYTPRAIAATGSRLSVSLNGFADAAYDYRITYRVGGRVTAQQTGVVTVFNGSSSTSTAAGVTPDTPVAPEAVATIGATAAAPPATSAFVSSATIRTSFVGVPGPGNERYNWQNTNQVNLSWSNLGTQPIRVQLDYVTATNPNGVSRVASSRPQIFTSGHSTGVSFTWLDPSTKYPDGQLPAGGISSVTRVRVYGQDAAGQYTVLLRDSAGPVGTNQLVWSAPATSVAPTFRYRSSGGSWIPRSVTTSGSPWRVDLTGIAAGQYEYYLGYQRSGESYDASSASGFFTIGAGTVTRDSQANSSNAPGWIAGVTSNASRVTWSQAANGATVTFEYLVGANWQPRAMSTSDGVNYSADMAGTGAGTYSYRIRYSNGGPVPLFEAKGSVSVTVTPVVNPPAVTVTGQSTVTFPAAVISPVSISSDRISWTYPAETGSSIRVVYRIDGGTSYDKPAEGSTPSYGMTFTEVPRVARETPYQVNYDIYYYRAGETDAYARSRGTAWVQVTNVTEQPTVTINSQSAAYPSSAQPIATPTVSGNLLRWTTPAEAGATIRFLYNGTQLGTTPWGSGYQVDVNSLANGVYNFEITYTRNGATDPYARGRGTLNVSRSVSVTGFGLTPALPPPVTVAPRILQTVDRWGNALAVTDAADQTTHYRYNQSGQLIETRQPQVTIVDTEGADVDGIVQTVRDTPISRNEFDLLGRLVATRDANGHLNRVQYDAVGRVLAETHADGGVRSFAYDAFDGLARTTDELSYRVWNSYDAAGRLTSVRRQVNASDSITESYVYDAVGRRIREINGENEATSYFYDLNDNMIRRRNALGFETQYEYDAQGRKTLERDAIGGTQGWSQDYFGRLQTHTDLGQRRYGYDYDRAGALEWQRQIDAQGALQAGGQNIRYRYNEAGQLVQIDDTGVNRLTEYRYDAAGRRVAEKTRINGLVHQNTAMEYDELGRLSRLSDLRYSLRYRYDAAGNRTQTVANYYNHQQLAQSQELWYVHDAMNRVVVSQGAAGARIDITPTQGTKLEYNAKGERTSATTYGARLVFENIQTRTNPGGVPGEDMWQDNPRYFTEAGYVTQRYTYDGIGRLDTTEQALERRERLGNGPLTVTSQQLVMSDRGYDRASRETSEQTRTLHSAGMTTRMQTRVYGADGHLLSQTTRRAASTSPTAVFDPQTAIMESSVVFTTDAAGVLRDYTVDVYGAAGGPPLYQSTYRNTYRLTDVYQESGQTVASSGTGAPQGGRVTREFNANDELTAWFDERDANRNRFFANNAQGQALTVVQGDVGNNVPGAFEGALARAGNAGRAQHFFFANGQSVGSFGQLLDASGAFKANFDVNYTPVSEHYPETAPSEVIVQSGDTLRTLAARVFGDAGLWYVIAEENGLTDPDTQLQAGIAVRIPNQVLSLSNTSSSFKPFDVTQALGDTTPTQPAPPPPKKKGCGVVGQILVIVVVIVVAYLTAGAAAGAFTPGAGAGATAGGAAATGTGFTVAGVSGLTAGQAFAAGAIGAAVGSAAGQGVGFALGMQDSFNWKSIAAAAISGGLGSGVLNVGSSIADAAINSAVSQGVNIALGLQDSFNWAAVASAAVAAPLARHAGGKVGGAVGRLGERAGEFAGTFTSSAINQLVYASFSGGQINYAQLAADAFGNALGNSIVEGMQGGRRTKESRDSDDALEEVEVSAQYVLDEIEVTARRIPEAPSTFLETVERLMGGQSLRYDAPGDLLGADWTPVFKIEGAGAVHEQIAKLAAENNGFVYDDTLDKGVAWPDVPNEDLSKTKTSYWGTYRNEHREGTLANRSHHGDLQFWHSMASGDDLTNAQVLDKIVRQAGEWYQQGLDSNSLFPVGKLLHMVQDSYSASHVVRDDKDRIMKFQNYSAQDPKLHGVADAVPKDGDSTWQDIPGVKQAIRASTDIVALYKARAPAIAVQTYLREHVYVMAPNAANALAGGSAPQFKPKSK